MALRGQAIQCPHILNAIETIPREVFVPDTLTTHAYKNTSLPIGYEQTISQPFVVAKMTQELAVKKSHRILEIGTGSGYQTAILALLSRRVYTIERLRALLVTAEKRLKALQIANVSYLHGDGYKGWPKATPFDRIIITCRVDDVPPALIDQLKSGGILIAPVGPSGGEHLVRIVKTDHDYETHTLIPVRFVPMMMGTE